MIITSKIMSFLLGVITPWYLCYPYFFVANQIILIFVTFINLPFSFLKKILLIAQQYQTL